MRTISFNHTYIFNPKLLDEADGVGEALGERRLVRGVEAVARLGEPPAWATHRETWAWHGKGGKRETPRVAGALPLVAVAHPDVVRRQVSGMLSTQILCTKPVRGTTSLAAYKYRVANSHKLSMAA